MPGWPAFIIFGASVPLMKYRFWCCLWCVICLSAVNPVRAQFSAGLGGTLGYPFFLNKEGYYNRPYIGGHAWISYEPQGSRLYPSLLFSIFSLQLPVTNAYIDNLNISVGEKELKLNLNYKLTDDEAASFVLSGGIGVAYINPTASGVDIGPQSSPLELVDSGRNFYYPQINFGLQYIRHLSRQYPIYGVLHANLAYTHIFEQKQRYYLRYGTGSAPANIKGELILPSAFVTIAYRFGERY